VNSSFIVHRSSFIVLGILGALTLFAVPRARAQTTSIEAQRQELVQTRDQLEAVERRLAELKDLRYHVQHSLEDDSIKLVKLRRLEVQIDQAQRDKEAAIARIRRAMYNVQQQIEERKDDLAQRLVTMYKYGRTFDLELLFSAKSMPDVYKKLFYMKMIAVADQRRMQELAELQGELVAEQTHFQYSAATLQGLQQEYLRQQQALKADQTFRAVQMSNLAQEEIDKQAMSERLAAAAEQIQHLVDSLEQVGEQSPGTPEQSTLKGGMPWPVTGAVKTGFGEQTSGNYGTQTRNNGIVIACTEGAPVKAVATGRVSYAEEFMSYGNLVIIDHGGGSFSLYGNLKDIAVGVDDVVGAGTIVGHAIPTLYFELRKGNLPVDPLSQLRH
jgi:septal ring factor EnvC (AmiA/AmiB activator)